MANNVNHLCLLMKSVPYGTVETTPTRSYHMAVLALFVPDQGVWKLVKERHRRNYVLTLAFFTMEYRKSLLLGVDDLSLYDDDDDDSHPTKRKTPPCSESKRTDKRSSYEHVSEYSSK
ncbi:unnamed protein product [Arabidopsis thaliana]|uniref:Uncharacterized protein n=1 Tax=Arabidopsis thaliana TaxID=3702 RepID=A0A5S9WRD8_ARATH|nr:unnamed protein product [Arabidopsis thaliana]